MNKKVIYTCIVGGYDNLMQPGVIDDSFDYICFSDDFQEKKIGVWEIRPIPYNHSDGTRKSRYVKLLPHEVLKEYDYSLWIDGNIRITGKELYSIVDKAIAEGYLMSGVAHPWNHCIYKENAFCYILKKINFRTAWRIKRHLEEEGMPRDRGLYENNIIFRRHNDPKIAKIDSEWWDEYQKISQRDQLSLMLVLYKNSFTPPYLVAPDYCARNVSFLSCISHVQDEKAMGRFHKKIIDLLHSAQRKSRRAIALLFLR